MTDGFLHGYEYLIGTRVERDAKIMGDEILTFA